MRCHGWGRSPERLAAYLSVLRELGAGDFEPWAERYARGGSVDRIASDIDYLLAHHDPRRCLNVGGAPYIFEHLMRVARPEADITTLDLEPGRFPNAAGRLRISLRQLDIETASAGDIAKLGQFECVILTEVFEHLRIDLLGTLRRLRALLTDDGVLYLSTPNGLGFNNIRRLFLRGRSGPSVVAEWSKLENLGHMGHVREYTLVEVREVLHACGYRIDDAFYRYGNRSGGSAAVRLGNMAMRALTAVLPFAAGNMVLVARRA